MKLKWKVAEAPTGRYRSFQKRSWPWAENSEEEVLFQLLCEDSYVPKLVKSGQHGEITVRVGVRKGATRGFNWHRLKARFARIEDAKAAAQKFYDDRPDLFVNDKE